MEHEAGLGVEQDHQRILMQVMSRILMVVMIRNLLHVLIHHDDPSRIAETKKISRVESLKNLILHGKAEPDLPPEVFNIPHGCSCR